MVVERRAEATVGSIGEGNGSIFVVLSKKKRFCVWVAGRFKILEFCTFCLVSVNAILVLSLFLLLCFFKFDSQIIFL